MSQIRNIVDFKNKYFRLLPVKLVRYLFEKVSNVSINDNGSFHGNNSSTTSNGGLYKDKANEIAKSIKNSIKESFIGKIIFLVIIAFIIFIVILIILHYQSIYAFFKVLFSEKYDFDNYMQIKYPKFNI